MNALLGCTLVVVLGTAPDNPLYKQLTEEGVCRRGTAECVKLPPPEMADGLSAAEQRAVIARIAGPTRRVDDLLRDSVVAPFVLRLGDAPTTPGGRPMRTIDLWFVAHGDLDRLDSEESLGELAEKLEKDSAKELPEVRGMLTAEQLRARGIEVVETERRKERFVHATTGLFDRVLLSATHRLVVTRGEESMLAAGAIDPRLTGDADYSNQWRPLRRLPSGKFEQGEATPYEASGFYAKVTKLKDPAGALWIEYHQAFDEPEGWFEGTGLLRARLPMAVQDGVRSFRRRLKEMER
jgi:hypothetical protein